MTTTAYPSIRQAVGLLAIVLLMTMLAAIPLGLLGVVAGDMGLATHPIAIGIMNLVFIGLGIWLGVRRTRLPVRVVLPLRGFSPRLLPPMLMSLAGICLVLSEVDNLLRTLLPSPDFMVKIMEILLGDGDRIWSSAFLLMGVAPVTEELLFRGVVLQGFLARYSERKAILVSSLLFGAFHLNPWQFVGGTFAGLLFGWWFTRTRNLLPCLMGHAVFNGIFWFATSFMGEIPGYTSDPTAPVQHLPIWVTGLGAVLLIAGIQMTRVSKNMRSPTPTFGFLSLVQRFGDLLTTYARDVYGPKQTPLMVSQLDVELRRIPSAESNLYAAPNRGGAGPTTNNLQFDGPTVRLLYGLTVITGVTRHAVVADSYLEYYLANLPDEAGFFPWGEHRGYDVVEDAPMSGHDEFKAALPLWDRMFAINPDAVRRQIEGLRGHIIDEGRSLAFCRHHPPGDEPHCMNSSAGAWIAGWAFLYAKTGEAKHLEWAQELAEYLWSLRNPDTGLLAAHPADPAYPEAQAKLRNRQRAARTEYLGPMYWLSTNLLHAQRTAGEAAGGMFREQALGYIRSFTERFDVDEGGSFFATFDLASGEPLFPRVTDGWQLTPQAGPEEAGSGVVGLRAPIALAFAYRETGEADLKESFDAFRPLFRLQQFEGAADIPHPIAAGLLAQAIGAWRMMFEATGDDDYLETARMMAGYAVRHYVREGWFVCGPPTVPRYRDDNRTGWETYSNRGGSAALALEVLRLAALDQSVDLGVGEDPTGDF